MGYSIHYSKVYIFATPLFCAFIIFLTSNNNIYKVYNKINIFFLLKFTLKICKYELAF